MAFNELINLTLKTLKHSVDDDISKEVVRLAYIKSVDKKFHNCSHDEIEKYLELTKE